MSEVQTPPRCPMWVVGLKKSKYSADHELPLTIVHDETTAKSLKALLDATGSDVAYIAEVPIWPAMRTEE